MAAWSAKGPGPLTDGPFAETREALGGYSIIDAQDLDEAIAIASGFFGSTQDSLATIEIRPILEIHAVDPNVGR